MSRRLDAVWIGQEAFREGGHGDDAADQNRQRRTYEDEGDAHGGGIGLMVGVAIVGDCVKAERGEQHYAAGDKHTNCDSDDA